MAVPPNRRQIAHHPSLAPQARLGWCRVASERFLRCLVREDCLSPFVPPLTVHHPGSL